MCSLLRGLEKTTKQYDSINNYINRNTNMGSHSQLVQKNGGRHACPHLEGHTPDRRLGSKIRAILEDNTNVVHQRSRSLPPQDLETNQNELIHDAHIHHSSEGDKILGFGKESRARPSAQLDSGGGGGGGQILPNPHEHGENQQRRKTQKIRDSHKVSRRHRESR